MVGATWGMPQTANKLLDALPRAAYQELEPALSPATVVFGQVLHEQGKAMPHVYFPQACVVSLLVVMEGNAALEVALVGYEGLVGVPLALGAGASPVRALVQGEGLCLCMA